jgi:excisionase family DNA binding protein
MTASTTRPSDPAFYSPQDVADRLQLPVATVYEWRKHKKGPPFVRIGKHLRIPAAALHAWEHEHFDQSN